MGESGVWSVGCGAPKMDCGKAGQSLKWDSHCPGHLLAARSKYPSRRHFRSLQRSPRNHHSHGKPTGHLAGPPRPSRGSVSFPGHTYKSPPAPNEWLPLDADKSNPRAFLPLVSREFQESLLRECGSLGQEGTGHLWRGLSVGGEP